MLDKAIALAAEKFIGKTDKQGEPYILHCIQVMLGVDQTDSELMQIAVLHDIVEDTDVTLGQLKQMGFSDRVVGGIAYMTRPSSTPYEEYIEKYNRAYRFLIDGYWPNK